MVCILLGSGFEEAEALVPADLLRRAGIEVILTGLDEYEVTGSHGITVQADRILSDIAPESIELLLLPGGLGGVESLSRHPQVPALIQAVAGRDRYLAAICAAPTLLASLQLLDGREAVCYPGMESQMAGAVLPGNRRVIVDGKLVTGQAAGSSFAFALTLIELLRGPELANEVRQTIHYQD